MAYPAATMIRSLVLQYANEGDDADVLILVKYLTLNFVDNSPKDLPSDEQREWLREHIMYAVVKFK